MFLVPLWFSYATVSAEKYWPFKVTEWLPPRRSFRHFLKAETALGVIRGRENDLDRLYFLAPERRNAFESKRVSRVSIWPPRYAYVRCAMRFRLVRGRTACRGYVSFCRSVTRTCYPPRRTGAIGHAILRDVKHVNPFEIDPWTRTIPFQHVAVFPYYYSAISDSLVESLLFSDNRAAIWIAGEDRTIVYYHFFFFFLFRRSPLPGYESTRETRNGSTI